MKSNVGFIGKNPGFWKQRQAKKRSRARIYRLSGYLFSNRLNISLNVRSFASSSFVLSFSALLDASGLWRLLLSILVRCYSRFTKAFMLPCTITIQQPFLSYATFTGPGPGRL